MSDFVIIPTFNERENISQALHDVFSAVSAVEVLVVDDHSPDGTGDLVESLKGVYGSRLHCLHRKNNKGIGPSYLDGFRYALKNGAEKIIQMDADGSHPPEKIPLLLSESAAHDLVIGSRYVSGGSTPDWSLRRRLLSYSANFYARQVLDMPIRDLTAGFKCFRRKVLEALDFDSIRSFGYGFQVEVVYRVFQQGFSIKEIPITFCDRTLGQSKMGLGIAWEGAINVFKIRKAKKSIVPAWQQLP